MNEWKHFDKFCILISLTFCEDPPVQGFDKKSYRENPSPCQFFAAEQKVWSWLGLFTATAPAISEIKRCVLIGGGGGGYDLGAGTGFSTRAPGQKQLDNGNFAEVCPFISR